MEHYELIIIIPGSRTETEVPATKERLRALLEEVGGVLVHEEDLGKQKLAYPIKREHYAYYTLFTFDLEPEALPKLHDQLRLSEHLLRHSIVKKEKKTPEQLEEEARVRARIHRMRSTEQKTTSSPTPAAVMPTTTSSPTWNQNKGEVRKPETPAEPVNLDELDKKLDEILDTPIEKI